MIMVYYYFSFLGCVNSQNLLNAMKKKHLTIKNFLHTNRPPKQNKIDKKKSGKTKFHITSK